MVRFEALTMAHVAALRADPLIAAVLTESALARDIAALGPAFAGIDDGNGGAVIGAAGLHIKWRGVASAWLIRGTGLSRRHWPAVTAKVLDVLRAAEADGIWRIEIDVRDDFVAAKRWAARLGFAPEGLRRLFGPDGADTWLYARLHAPALLSCNQEAA